MTIAARRLLVVDDDRDFADSLVDVLRLSGYEVEVAYSGEEAVRRCVNEDFDLALMDVRMPGKDGVQSFLEIQAVNPDFRVILMSGYAVPGLLEQAAAMGARAIVRKPLAPDQLLELIERHRHRFLVLVVDDDADFASSMAMMLEDAGYAVDVARDRDTAIAKVTDDRPAAMVLDLRLDPGNGLEIFNELTRRCLQTPTVVVSAYVAQETDAVRTLRARNVAGVLEKPVAPQALLDVLAAIPA